MGDHTYRCIQQVQRGVF